jgi:ABC-type multidrug transport system ATPase subunit
MDNLVIQVQNFRKTYGELVAVDDISFDVRQGEIFGLLGPNGAGKTTTFATSLACNFKPPVCPRVFAWMRL